MGKKNAKDLRRIQKKLKTLWGGVYDNKTKEAWKRTWELRQKMLNKPTLVRDILLDWPHLGNFEALKDDFILMHGQKAYTELTSNLAMKIETIWHHAHFPKTDIVIRGMTMVNEQTDLEGSNLITGKKKMIQNVQLLNLALFTCRDSVYDNLLCFNLDNDAATANPEGGEIQAPVTLPSYPILNLPITTEVQPGEEFDLLKHTGIINPLGELEIFVEGDMLMKLYNLYDGILALYFAHHVFRIEYNPFLAIFFKYLDYLAGIHQDIFPLPVPTETATENENE